MPPRKKKPAIAATPVLQDEQAKTLLACVKGAKIAQNALDVVEEDDPTFNDLTGKAANAMYAVVEKAHHLAQRQHVLQAEPMQADWEKQMGLLKILSLIGDARQSTAANDGVISGALVATSTTLVRKATSHFGEKTRRPWRPAQALDEKGQAERKRAISNIQLHALT